MNDGLKSCLISDFEKNQDDKEPYLQYAVRVENPRKLTPFRQMKLSW